MAYLNKEKTIEAIRKYADIKHSNGEPIEYVNGILKSVSVISEQPSADVEEVKHGYWIEAEGGLFYCCTNCGYIVDYQLTSYCPNCGAKMDGGNAE